jgi:hypothetical protein
MLNVSASQVSADPFPHVISEAILPPDLFARLKADYPSTEWFDEQLKLTGTGGSRTGAGFDIYRGDAAYDRLVASSPAWAEFDAWINSQAFVDCFTETFGAHMDAAGCMVDVAASKYDRNYIEPREVLTEHATLGDKVSGVVNKVMRPIRGKRAVNLFTRLDIQKAIGGYAKTPHTDRPNRLCSLIVYFTDSDAVGSKAASCSSTVTRTRRDPASMERHPRPENVEVFATLTPKANLGVFFPCSNNSYHGVTAVTSKGIPRDFLYINISGVSGTLW